MNSPTPFGRLTRALFKKKPTPKHMVHLTAHAGPLSPSAGRSRLPSTLRTSPEDAPLPPTPRPAGEDADDAFTFYDSAWFCVLLILVGVGLAAGIVCVGSARRVEAGAHRRLPPPARLIVSFLHLHRGTCAGHRCDSCCCRSLGCGDCGAGWCRGERLCCGRRDAHYRSVHLPPCSPSSYFIFPIFFIFPFFFLLLCTGGCTDDDVDKKNVWSGINFKKQRERE